MIKQIPKQDQRISFLNICILYAMLVSYWLLGKEEPNKSQWYDKDYQIKTHKDLRSTLLVIRFVTDLLRKYRGSVVIMVGWGKAEPSPTMFTTDPLYFRNRSVINLML